MSEATALPIEPQPQPQCIIVYHNTAGCENYLSLRDIYLAQQLSTSKSSTNLGRELNVGDAQEPDEKDPETRRNLDWFVNLEKKKAKNDCGECGVKMIGTITSQLSPVASTK